MGREGEVLSFVDLCHCERYCVKLFSLGLGADVSEVGRIECHLLNINNFGS